MRERLRIGIAVSLSFLFAFRQSFAQVSGENAKPRRNVIIFIADGLRPGSVNERDTPAIWAVKTQGVYFSNSHSLFPTFTTANASAIATGHGLGDTGDFSNTIWAGYATFDTGNFELPTASPTPFIETDQVLSDLADHYHGNFLSEKTLLDVAHEAGYNIAAVGKQGPTAIQGLASISPKQRKFPSASSFLILDDATGNSGGLPLSAGISSALAEEGLSAAVPTRSNGYGPTADWNNGFPGTAKRHGTLQANRVQQQWFADAATRVILPSFRRDLPERPFLLVFWSRDPDGTKHNQGDSLGSLYPGINGDTSRLAVQNADRNLKQILDWLDANPGVKAITDIFITSDHGFATISRREISRTGQATQSEAAQHYYLDASGTAETETGTLPNGFLAIDLALGLKTNLFDPDRRPAEGIRKPFRQVRLNPELFEHPANGNGLLGMDVEKGDGSDAKAIIAANGGSDLVYVPDHNPETVRQIASLLSTFDYVGSIFVDDQYGPLPGALPLSAIGLVGQSPLPRPAIVVSFKVFYLNPANLQTAVQVSDTSLQEGQGMHGGIGRDSTFNTMAAMGPDFKSGFTDKEPVGNEDIAPTIAQIIGVQMPSHGKLRGRVIREALRGEPDSIHFTVESLKSPEARRERR